MVYHKAKSSIELGLSVVCAVAQPGQTLGYIDLAEICDCTKGAIWNIENRALKKIRNMPDNEKLKEFWELD